MIGILGFALIVWLVEFCAFRQLPPDERAFKTVLVAYIISGLISGFVGAPDRYYWEGWFWNAIPAFLFWLWFRNRLRKRWEDNSDAEVFE
jgi:hypothetical protein